MFSKVSGDRTQFGALWCRQVERLVRKNRNSIQQHADKPAVGAILVIKGRNRTTARINSRNNGLI